MNAELLLDKYTSDSEIQSWAHSTDPLFLKGLKGSQLAFVLAAFHQLKSRDLVIILKDKEEAAYFNDDIQNLLSNKKILYFPSSFKRPYAVEETDNANILQRADVLNRLQADGRSPEIIVTYAEALAERVIGKRSLASNTFALQVGEKVNSEFISELLITYDFEQTDFVYEAGQFAVRGGIIDIFSFGNELPFRVELFGDEIEEIRSFDPVDQLSKESLTKISIVPNVQTRLMDEERTAFFDYLKIDPAVAVTDLNYLFESIGQFYTKAVDNFETIVRNAGGTTVVLTPQNLFETEKSIKEQVLGLQVLQGGNTSFSLKGMKKVTFRSSAQPPFAKNFNLLVDNLHENASQNLNNYLVAESLSQLKRLDTILEEIGNDVPYQTILLNINKGFIDYQRNFALYTDHEIFERFHAQKQKNRFSKSKALTLKEIRTLQPGDYVTHIDYGIGRFAGMDIIDIGGRKQEAVRLIYRDNDLLYVSVHSLHKISKYSGKEGEAPTMSKLGTGEWEAKKKKAKKKVKDIAKDLIRLYAKRRESQGFSFPEDNYMQAELESSFIFQDTEDQARATQEVKDDMKKYYPMDRLVCGDVGFGKTEVAVRAAFKAVSSSKQVAVLVPTTILAFQHYRTFSQRLADMPVKINYINRFKSSKQIRESLKELKEGKVDIIIGTHRLVSKDVEFKDLGLLVIDEEQKFGVKVKDRLKEFRVNVDVLTLTATPIPRTLHFSLMGARDLSVISTPPPNRQPVTTEIHAFNEDIIRDSIAFELRRGGQVFFVHNRVGDIEHFAGLIRRLVPEATVGIAHGQMDGSKLEDMMLSFIEGRYDVLVSTNIIESGLDIPNANTIIINQAHMFGLSDLHQMRGRVGRSNKKAYCYLLTPTLAGLTAEARKRLGTLEEFSDLGDGFKVAMRDLDIRGAGDLLGAEQSGFITDLGFDTYHKILDEAVDELKETEFKSLFSDQEQTDKFRKLVPDTSIETDLEIIIPEEYVKNISERLSLYTRLDDIKNEEELNAFSEELQDRFGPPPPEVESLLTSVRVRWVAQELGFDRLILKNGEMKGYIMHEDNQEYFNSEVFGQILAYIQQHPQSTKMKQLKNRPMIKFLDVEAIDQALQILSSIRTSNKK